MEEVNRLLPGSGLEGLGLEDIVRRARGQLAEQAALAWSHGFYWTCLSPRGGGEPGGRLGELLARQFGDFARFREEFTRMAQALFGSGWVWLVKNADGGLEVTKTENGVNPLCFGQTALLGCDVWEHSYYIDFRNKRPAYLTNFLDKLVNWEAVAAKL